MAKQGIVSAGAALHAVATVTVDIVTQDVHVAIGHATDVEVSQKRHATVDAEAGTLTFGPGRYKVSYRGRVSTAKANKTAILVDGAALDHGIDAQSGAGAFAGEAIVELTAEATIAVGLANTADTTDLDVTHFDFVVVELESKEPRQPR